MKRKRRKCPAQQREIWEVRSRKEEEKKGEIKCTNKEGKGKGEKATKKSV
jgi:hypothetical protein